jgi:hypothetical protein
VIGVAGVALIVQQEASRRGERRDDVDVAVRAEIVVVG